MEPQHKNKNHNDLAGGFIYEKLILSILAIRCCFNKKIKDFKIGSNIPGFGSLDDIVIEMDYDNGSQEVFVIQLKYKKEEGIKSIKINLNKYIQDYKIIKDRYKDVKVTVIIHTKANEQLIPQHNALVKYDIDLNLKMFNTNRDGLLFKYNTKLVNINDKSISSDLIQQFFDNCYLLANQCSVEDPEKMLGSEFDYCVGNLEIRDIYNYFEMIFSSRNELIYKEEISWMLKIKTLYRFINLSSADNEVIENENVILKTLTLFNLAQVSKTSMCVVSNIIKRIIRDRFSEFNSLHENISEQILNQFNLKKLTNIQNGNLAYKDLILLLWMEGEVPLPLCNTEENKKIINFVLQKFNPDFSIILQTEDVDNTFKHIQIFHDFTNIRDEIVKEVNFKNIKIKLHQNQSVSLEELHFFDETALKTINADLYIKLFSSKENHLKSINPLSCYIPRRLKPLTFNKNVTKDEVVTFTVHSNCPELSEFLRKHNTLRKESHCYLIDYNEAYLCSAYNGDIKSLSNYRTSKVLTEEELLRLNIPINIIDGNAGMGKSQFLRNIQYLLPKDYWTILLNLTNYHMFWKDEVLENKESLIEYLVKHQMEGRIDDCNLKFLTELFKNRLKNKKIYLLIDGFDEVDFNPENIRKIFLLLQVPLFITTRPTKKEVLEKELRVPSIKIMEFSEDNQIEFLQVLPNLSLNYINKVLDGLKIEKSFLGVPLLLKILVNILPSLKEIENIDLLVLYNTYFDKNMEHYKNCDRRAIKHLAFRTFFKEFYGTFFKEKLFQEDCKDFQNTIATKKDVIFSGFDSEKEPTFIHRTFAECLCAQVLSEICLHEQFTKIYEELVSKIEYNLVKYFFDLIICKNLPLHYAALRNDKNIEILINKHDYSNEKDKLGRTVLHVLSTYGDYSERTNIQKNKKLYTFVRMSDPENYNGKNPFLPARDTIKLLLTKTKIKSNFKLVEDRFEKNIIDYSYLSFSYDVLNEICKYSSINFTKRDFKDLKILNNLTVFAIVLHHNEILNCIVKSNDFRERIIYKSLMYPNFGPYGLHAAVLSENVEALELLILNGSLLEKKESFLEVIDGCGNTALHLAARKGNVELADMLVMKGANVNAKADLDDTPLMEACSNNKPEIVKYLINNGAHVNSQNRMGQTALHFAVQNKSDLIIHILLINNAYPNIQDFLGLTPWQVLNVEEYARKIVKKWNN
ncbi:unnamed protein product [Brassicogethes aeneus]|uniref:NACHT domain-containing protein n=1 Tax=Brassicogethes aeneus TaxID=1431903 RepID=A0A9P0FDJ6_BRAAE|nr:unnamed protein product [Brassicogethes aeneus]